MKTKTLLGFGVGALGAYYLLKKPALSGIGSLGLTAARPISVITAQVVRLAGRLSQEISQASSLTGVPKWIIVAIAANEIGDFPYSAVNHAMKDPAAGVMQQTYGAIVDTIYFAKKDGVYSTELEAYIRGKMGAINYAKLIAAAAKRTPDFSLSMTQYLVVPEFCLVMGALMLRVLIARLKTSDGSINLAELASSYNKGYSFLYSKYIKRPDLTIDQVYSVATGKEGKAYVKNVPGTGGYFEQAKKLFGMG